MARETNIKLRRSATQGAIPTASNLDLGELAINTFDGKLYVKKTAGSNTRVVQVGSSSYSYGTHTGSTETLIVKVASSPGDHRYNGSGSGNKYFINDVPAPYLKLLPGVTYRFDTSDSSNSGHPFRFYLDAARNNLYSTGVTIAGSSGSSGSYTEITPTDSTPMVLHYQCSAHAYMGNQAAFDTRNLSEFTTDNLTEGSSNLYFTNARARSAISVSGDLSYNSGTGVISFTERTDAQVRALISVTDSGGDGSLSYNNSTGVITYTGPSQSEVLAHISAGAGISISGSGVISNSQTQYNNSDARSAISVTDAGGDGSLAYNSTTGVITYTGPSAAEVRAHISGGTGVTFSSGTISIGQAVATTDNVEFNDLVVAGNLTVSGTTTTVNSNTVNIGDAIITLNSDETGSPTQDGGIEIERGTSTNKTFIWDETNDRWTLGSESLVAGTFIGNLTGNVTGTVSSLSNQDTDSLSEGSSNLYFTNARADGRIAAASIEDLSNVNTASPSVGHVLKWTGTEWSPSAESGGTVTETFKTIAVSGQTNVVADTATDTLTLVEGSNMTITTNASGDTITFASSGGGSVGANAADVLKTYEYTATSGQTTFTGSDNNSQTLAYTPGAVQVFVNGVLQKLTTDYTTNNVGTTITLVNGATTNDHVAIVAFLRTIGIGNSVVNQFTGDGTTTAFTLSADPENENNLLVYIDGVYQQKTDYTVSGTTLTLDTAPGNGAIIETVASVGAITEQNALELAGNLTLTGLSAQNSEATSLMINGSNIVGTRELGSNAFTSNLSAYDTDNLSEGSSNLYYTDARVSTRADTILNHSNHTNITVSKVGAELRFAAASSYGNSDVSTFLADASTNVTIGGNLTVNGTTTTLNSTTLDVDDINITIASGAGNAAAANGAGLTIDGANATLTYVSADDEFNFNKGIKTTAGNINIGGSNNELRFYEGSNYVGFEAPALSSNQIWVLPDSDGVSGYALKTDGSGNLSWGLAGGNAFETISVSGQSNVVADSSSDTLTLVAGTGMTITTNASSDEITFASAGGNAFGNIAVSGQTTVAADQSSDTVTLVGAGGIDITTDASTDTVTLTQNASFSPLVTDLFTATSGQTAFTLTQTPASEDTLIVFIEGIYQNKNSYALSGTTLTLDSPGANSGQEVVVHQVGKGVSGVSTNFNTFTGNGSTTNFTLNAEPFSENDVLIFSDGVYQEKSEFSVSGTTLSFGSAPANGASLEVLVPVLNQINVPAAGSVVPASLSTGGPAWDSAGNVTINTNSVLGNTSTNYTGGSGSAVTLATHSATTYRSVEYIISLKEISTSDKILTKKILAMHDGTDVYLTEYAEIDSGLDTNTSFTVILSGGNLLLQVTSGASNNFEAKVHHTAIKV